MVSYRLPTYQPTRPVLSIGQSKKMGNFSSMTAADWLYLLGGAVVGGAGINGIVGQFRGPGKMNAIPVLINLVLAGVGLTLFVDKGRQAFSA